MNFFNKLAIMIMNSRVLASTGAGVDEDGNLVKEKWMWVAKLNTTLKQILAPIMAVVAAAGCIYAIVIAVQMARADSGEKREEAKKRLISVIVAVVVLVVLILFFTVFLGMILEAAGIPIKDYAATEATAA